MKLVLKLEEMAMLALSVYALFQAQAVWWMYLLLLIAPDIGMAGYAINNRIGAIMYNLFHHKAVAIALYLVGLALHDALMLTGIILFGHSSLDRLLGYGLKYEKGFKFTHLGMIGKNA